MKKIYLICFLLSASFQSFAQAPFWAFNIGGIVASPNQDGGYSCAVGPDGTLCVTGRFSGTMDLDPGPGVYNITSNGLTDIFIATYSSSGAFNWGFGMGGSTNDGGYNVRFDPFGNIVMVGFYQTSADFDPGPGLGILTSMGGTGPINYGEGFVAKYSSTGAFLWAQSLGGPTVYDYAEGLTIDALGCIYVSGEYNSTMTISPSITFSSATEGTGYLIKYDPAGTVVWGHAFGEPGVGAVATVLRGLQVSGGFVYACGQFKGTANFRPWAAPYMLSTLGGSTDIDALIAKYDTAGNIVFVKAINGPGPDDEFGSIALDGSDNIYVAGWETGATQTFDPLSPGTSTVTAPGGGTNMDIVVAKFNSDGIYQWGQIHGGVGDDISRSGIDVFDNSVYVTGWFTNTVDFDASPAVNSLTSSGLSDIFLARYDLDGNYICAFRTGTPGISDWGYYNAHSEAGEIYTTGQFGGAGTDFDPTAGTWPLSSLGGTDVYLAKYDMCGSVIAPSCDSLELADTVKICSIGDTATLHAALYGTNPILSIAWTPPTGLSSTTILNPLLTYAGPGYYYVTVRSLLPINLVDNGDFSAGNTGFTSSYTYAPPPSGTLIEGNYSVHTNPNGVHSGFTVMGDHTTGTGNMMIINGGPSPVDVWCQTITVNPNTDYDFSAWFANCSAVTTGADVPVLQFRINGVLQGVPTTVTAAPGTWVNFSTTWNSGPSTSATICIYDGLTTASGNDFVIDDIVFREICTIKDSVFIATATPDTLYGGFDTSVCDGLMPLTLSAPAGYATYVWSTGSTSSTGIVATTGGTYWVRGVTGCMAAVDTFKIEVNPSPVVYLGNDTAFCIDNVYVLSSPQPAGSVFLWSTGATGDTIHVGTTGGYTLTVTNSYSCTATDAVNISVSPYPVVDLGPDTVNCNGYPFLIMSSGTYVSPTYLWHDLSAGPTFTAVSTGTYWLQVTDGGCTSADTIYVEIKYDTFTLFNTDTAICKGQSVQVFANADPSLTIQWVPTTGMPISNVSSPLISPDTSAYYVVTASLDGCPDIRDSFYIDVQPNPVIFMGPNRHVCQYDSIRIIAYVTPAWYTHYSYDWTPITYLDHPDLPSVIFNAGDTTEVVVTVSTPAGCKAKDSIMVLVHPSEFATITNDTDICPHDSVLLVASGGTSYKWSPGTYLDDPDKGTTTSRPITTQNYSMVATNEWGCHDTLSVLVTVLPAAVVTLEDSVTIYPGESYQISPATNAHIFSWTPAGGLNNKYLANPIATPEVSTKYIVRAFTEQGCKTMDSINIFVDDNALISVPNVFTPGAGMNNVLRIIKRGLVTLRYFRIYNRWGNLVYESSDMDAGWDGTYKGVPQPMGVFVYTVEGRTNAGKIVTKSGNVTLLR